MQLHIHCVALCIATVWHNTCQHLHQYLDKHRHNSAEKLVKSGKLQFRETAAAAGTQEDLKRHAN